MGHDMDRDAQREQAAQAEAEVARKEDEFREWVKSLLAVRENRLIISRFMDDVGVDKSPFNTTAMTQSHLIGRQDAGRWWQNLIREAAPEKEPVMRAEYAKYTKKRN